MCTALTLVSEQFYFGRTLDYELSYGETVTVTPRKFPFSFRHAGTLTEHYAMIGMAHIADGYPLYYDAVNEHGLGMAGLNFVGNAKYGSPSTEKQSIAQFECIPWVLSQCENLQQARALLQTADVVDTPFSCRYPVASLHWLIADRSGAITVERTADGLHVYENPLGVLTNNPPFPDQLRAWDAYSHLTAHDPDPDAVPTQEFSRGRGGLGLPGDLTSQSRFVRAAYARRFSVSGSGKYGNVNQFFHLLGTVEQTRGCCRLDNQTNEITIYTACCNADRGIYYYTTYENSRVTAVNMHREDLNTSRLVNYPLVTAPDYKFQN